MFGVITIQLKNLNAYCNNSTSKKEELIILIILQYLYNNIKDFVYLSMKQYEFVFHWNKVKVGGLHPIHWPGSYWERSSVLPVVGVEPTQR